MSKSKLQMVKEFNNEVVKMEGVRVAHCLSPERVEWFKTVVKEELSEFEEAWKNKDCVGMLDALIDATYFILGRVQECGFTEIQWDKAFIAVHEANMTKHAGNKGRGSDTDAVKDADWVGPEERIKDILSVDMELPCENIAPVRVNDEAVQGITHREPSVYLENDGDQRILSIDELNLFAKMSPVFKEVTEIAIKKSQDYNNGNGTPTSRAIYFPFGLLSYAQMLHTKSQRLNSLAQQNKLPNNESIRDTLLDMINYAAFAVEAIDKGEI